MKKITGYIILAVLSMFIATAVSMAHGDDHKPTPADKAFEFRHGLMHTLEWKFGKLVEAKMKGDKTAFRKNAADMAFLSTMVTEGFELKNSIVDESKAKKEIWEDWDKFQDKARNLQEATRDLSAPNYDFTAFDPKKFGGQNCGGCHRDFRVRDDD